MGRRSYGTGSLLTAELADGTRVYVGKFRNGAGRQVKRRIGPVRGAHRPDGLTKAQAEMRLREVMQAEHAVVPLDHVRTLQAASDAWLAHLEASGAKASSVRAYRAALGKWFLPFLGDRSLDRVAVTDVEDAMRRRRNAGARRQEHPQLRRRPRAPRRDDRPANR